MTAYSSRPTAAAAASATAHEVTAVVAHNEGRWLAAAAPVSGGLCFPRGAIVDPATVDVQFDVKTIQPAELTVLDRWPDGSLRWGLVSFVMPDQAGALAAAPTGSAGLRCRVRVHSPGSIRPFEPQRQTSVRWSGGAIVVQSRDLGADIPVERVWRLEPDLRDLHGRQIEWTADPIAQEFSGTVRQIFRLHLRCVGDPLLTLQLRLTHWLPTGQWHVESRLRNSHRAVHPGGLWDLGDARSFLFRGLNLQIRSDDLCGEVVTRWIVEAGTTERCSMSPVGVRQFGSGGPNWRSAAHVDASGQVTVAERGYEVSSDTGTLRGLRAQPLMILKSREAALAVSLREFWQNFPASIFSDGASVQVGLFATSSGAMHELQAGEQKTHTIVIWPDPPSKPLEHLANYLNSPRLVQDPGSVRDAGVIPWLMPENDWRSTIAGERFAVWRSRAVSGRHSIAARRDSIDEYGWRNFGELPADHEQRHFAGSGTVVSHYNNQFDPLCGGILQLLTSGDATWYELCDPLARHVMDIDIYHTVLDRAAFNGGLFWHTDHYVAAGTATHRTYSKQNQLDGQPYGGGPSCEHNYTTGLLHFFYLTGNPEARDTVLSLADWVIRMDDGSRTVFGLLDEGPTGAASATVSPDFHGPGRGAGNSINALLDAWLLTGSSHYWSKLDEIVRRCVHPRQDIDALQLTDAESRWSYTVFLTALHRAMLVRSESHAADPFCHYSRAVLQHFGRWMAAHEQRTLNHPERLKYPTEAWAAQDLRKANVLRAAASCELDPLQANAMRDRADGIAAAAWTDLESFGDAQFSARCLAILLTEGLREVSLGCRPWPAFSSMSADTDFGSWTPFVSQRTRIKQLLRSPVRLLRASLNACHPVRWLRAARALRAHWPG